MPPAPTRCCQTPRGALTSPTAPARCGHNISGNSGIAIGYDALLNDTGSANVALGINALSHNTTGASNVAIGNGAGHNLTTGTSNIEIANAGGAADARKIRIGTPGTQTAAFLAGVNGVTIPGPTKTVVVNANGQLGTATSTSSTAAQPNTTPLLRHEQHEIDQLTAQNHRLAAQIAHLTTLLPHRR